jgi:HrpA-like RNA helicase
MLTYAAVSSSSKGNRGDSVLVFLPGIQSIEDVKEALSEALGRDEAQSEWILPLHGRLSAEEQKRVFLRPPKGVFKVADADGC